MTKSNERTKLDLFVEILKDPDRKPLLRMIYETFYLFLIYKEVPVHYFSRYLFKKDVSNIRDYLPNKFLGEKLIHLFNDNRVKEVLDNKLYFDLFYRQFNVNLPKIVMYNHRKIFIAGDKTLEVKNSHDFKFLLGTVFKLNPQWESIMVKKTYASSSGKNIYKLFLYQLESNPEIVNEIYSEVIKSEFLFQETIRQHSDLEKLNPACLNSIRIDTFTDIDGEVGIMSAYLRMSMNNNHVDNISSGGCLVGIVLQTGRLKKFGYSTLQRLGVKILTEHPVTKTVFENFSIPFFPQVQSLVLNAASLMPGLRLVGWDVAISESGPVLIEGNSDYAMSGNDFSYGGYLSNPTFRKVLNEINYL